MTSETKTSESTCCFFGHRKINVTESLKEELFNVIEDLINNGTTVFLFGSRSQFDDLCYSVVTELKKRYPNIRRINVRAEFPHADGGYLDKLLLRYEESYYPEEILNAGKAVYAERNHIMIDKSDICVVYYDESYLPAKRSASKRSVSSYQPKSGTKIAYEYAQKRGKKIINLFDI